MHLKINTIILLAIIFVLTGCSAMKPQVGHEVSSVEPAQEGTITLAGASSRYIVKNKDGSFCFGPSPDATFTDSMGTSLGLTLVDTSTSSSSDSMEDAHSRSGLGGRNPNVLITREILFETCLLVERAKLSPSQMVELYKTTLDAIVKINQRTLDGAAITSDNSEASSLSLSNGTISESSSSTDTSSTD
jgi:energy-coupling factor transporter ATP-binding protein EcfA2